MGSNSFTLGNVEYSVAKFGLRKWLELEELHNSVQDYMRDGNMIEVANSIYSCLSLFTGEDADKFKDLFWMEVSNAYLSIIIGLIPTRDFPLLRGNKGKEEGIVWDYEGRTWYVWSNMLASSYGYSQEYIAEMDFEDAIALVQEILINEQLKKEWEWQLSEIAYPYNPNSKKSEFKALPRPSWMIGMNKLKPIENIKLPVDMIPSGVILKWTQDEEIIN